MDAAPIIAARELGFFAEEGLAVTLERQLGWANVRDKLTFGHLDASHSIQGMPLASQLGRDWFAEPLVAVMSLGSGGNAISISKRLADSGVNSAATLAKYIRDRHRDRQIIFAHVFNYSMHHYLLREWLASAGINPDLDVQLVTIPPSQVAEHMNRQYIDGFCVGEPWNMLALRKGYGTVVAATVDILPHHPEKVLAVGRGWAAKHPAEVLALVRGILKACAYCEHPANFRKLADLLARPHYINAPAEVIEASLAADRTFAVNPRYKAVRPDDWQIRSFSTAYTFPSATHPAWMMEQMIRWGHLAQDTDLLNVAQRCVDSGPYRAAALAMGLECPDDDFPPMALRGGRFYDARVAQQTIPIATTAPTLPQL